MLKMHCHNKDKGMETKRRRPVDEYSECRTTNENRFNGFIPRNYGRNQPKSRLVSGWSVLPDYSLFAIRCTHYRGKNSNIVILQGGQSACFAHQP